MTVRNPVSVERPGVPDLLDEDLVNLEHVETPPEKPKYDRFMRTESHVKQDWGVDPETGWRYEYWDIGMTRNSTRKKMTKVFLEPIPHIVLSQDVPLRGWYESKFEPKNVRPRPCFTESILTSPYGGFCSVGCAFCYINNGVRGYRGQGVTVVDPSYPDKIKRQLTGMRTGAAVYMSSFIDPFLELEDYYHNTERTARAVVEVGLPIYFLTRKPPPVWTFDLLKKNPYSYMQFSVNTPSSDDWRRLSPRAVPLETMMENVRAMHDHGIYVSIQVNPIVAGVTSNEEIVELIYKLAEVGADHLIFKYVEIVYPAAQAMIQQIKNRFPGRAERFTSLFTQNIGGVKTVDEGYRKAGLDLFMKETKRAGVTMSVCYEYEYERGKDGSVVSKTGVSKGRQYTTSDQCHGHRVPVFSRPLGDVLFKPMEFCHKSGCLHCADDQGGEEKVPCGNLLLAKAPALDPDMLKAVADLSLKKFVRSPI